MGRAGGRWAMGWWVVSRVEKLCFHVKKVLEYLIV